MEKQRKVLSSSSHNLLVLKSLWLIHIIYHKKVWLVTQEYFGNRVRELKPAKKSSFVS